MTKRTAGKFFISFMLLTGVYALVVAAAYITQTNIIFQSLGASVSPPKSYEIEEITFTTSDDVDLYGWWLDTPGATRTILYFQGNGRNFSSHTQRLKTFTRLGCNALLFDYRGYGKSQGKIKRESDIYLDADAAWEYLTMTRNIVDGDIILWGRSLGGAVAVELARGLKPAALILESTFYSLGEVAEQQYWFLPTRYLLRYHFQNGDKIGDVSAPVIIIHSPSDRYIPFDHGQRLYQTVSAPKAMLETTGHHLELFDRNELYLNELEAILKRCGELG